MINVLIDTDVILDFFFDRKPFSEDAAKILTLCESKNVHGYVTPVSCSNIYYLLRRTAPHGKVLEKIKQLLMITDVLQMDRNVVIHALNSGFSDFEDGLQYAAAVDNGGVSAIITRNVSDYKKSKIPVMTPDSFVRSRGEY